MFFLIRHFSLINKSLWLLLAFGIQLLNSKSFLFVLQRGLFMGTPASQIAFKYPAVIFPCPSQAYSVV